MGLRPGHCYRNEGLANDRAYTRVAITVQNRNYIGSTPGLKIRQFNMGNPTKQFSHILDLVIDESVQIRDNAIESSRITINRYLNRKIGKDAYFMRIRPYPFHILRENKQAQGAHADRIQQGMSHSFGKPIGRAIRTRPGQKVISILVDEPHIKIAKEALLRANARLPCDIHVKIGKDVNSIGTRPRFIKEVVEEVVVEVKEEEKAAPAEAGREAGKAATAEKGKTETKQETGKAEAKKK